MHLLNNRVVCVGSWLLIPVSILWIANEGGFEPWVSLIAGIIGVASNGLNFFKQKRSLSPEARIAARDKWRPIFQEYFHESARKNFLGDAIIHDVNRLDHYPETSDTKGISSWFRVGLMGTHNRGILLGLEWICLEEEEGKLKKSKNPEDPETIKAILLGEVPYEAIESVNFDGDEFYNKPHIFCHFDHNGEPYERLFYGTQNQLDPKFPYYYTEVMIYNPNKKSKLKFWDRSSETR